MDERTEESKGTEESMPAYIRWIPMVPLGALLIVLDAYLIAAEVLARITI